jgi:outer membrane protein assembly factor BamA
MRWHLLLFAYCFFVASMYGQSDSNFVFIQDISIKGNKKTHKEIIQRELLLHAGDTVPINTLSALLERSEELIMNTGLFNRAQISFQEWEGTTNTVKLLVFVEEAWYLFPIPIFELADRNFNVWWVEQGRSIQRTNIGLEFAHINISGRKDKLKCSVKYGYTRKYTASYQIPYINKKQTLGLFSEVAFFRNRELNYITLDNKQVFYSDGNRFIYDRFRASFGMTLRPKVNSFHTWSLSYRKNRIGNAIALDLNPDFFLDGRNRQEYFTLNYRFVHDMRDVRAYAWKGNFFSAMVSKDGLGIFPDRNALDLTLEYREYIPMGRRWSLGLEAKTKVSLIRSRQPYNDNQSMGFGNNYLRGFEYYIVDGLDMGFLKTSMRFNIIDASINFGRLVPIDAFKNMPFRANLTFNNDIGYVNGPYTRQLNPLNNRALWGGGIGLDFIVYYNKTLQVEYSFNDLMENGLFLHLNMNI